MSIMSLLTIHNWHALVNMTKSFLENRTKLEEDYMICIGGDSYFWTQAALYIDDLISMEWYVTGPNR